MKRILALLPGLLVIIALLMPACENDIERVQILTQGDDLPTVKGTNIRVLYSDSARVKVQIEAPEYENFPSANRPYMEFPKGMEVIFFDDSLQVESEIRCNYALYFTEEGLWQATGDVEARNLKDGSTLQTEELFWDEPERRIYSNVFTRVQDGEDIMYGKGGFEAEQSFENWYLKGSSGEIVIEDEE